MKKTLALVTALATAVPGHALAQDLSRSLEIQQAATILVRHIVEEAQAGQDNLAEVWVEIKIPQSVEVSWRCFGIISTDDLSDEGIGLTCIEKENDSVAAFNYNLQMTKFSGTVEYLYTTINVNGD